VVTGDSWRCAPLTSMTTSDHGGLTLDGSGDREFVVGPTPMDFNSARAYCQSIHDDLASIHSEEEQLKAYTACRATVGEIANADALNQLGSAPHGCWIGLGDQFREGRYSWSDGTTVDYMNWAPGEPNDMTGQRGGGVSGDEDAVELDLRPDWQGKWNDDIESGASATQNIITGMYPLCETSTFVRTDTTTYIGCFKDEGDKDGDGVIDCTQAGDAVQGATTKYNVDGTDANIASVGTCRDMNGQSVSVYACLSHQVAILL
jgi:hypothetical protein